MVIDAVALQEFSDLFALPSVSTCSCLHGHAAALWVLFECLQQMCVFCRTVESSVFLVKEITD